jgi:hypothetical protein
LKQFVLVRKRLIPDSRLKFEVLSRVGHRADMNRGVEGRPLLPGNLAALLRDKPLASQGFEFS